MSSKTDFSPEEWTQVAASPMLVCTAVSAADPSGLWGLMKEASAGGFALVQAKQDANTNSLARVLADDFTNSESRTAITTKVQAVFKEAQASEIKDRALVELRAVASILDTKVPQDAPAFKNWLRNIAQKAAETAKEGGFLGFGGVAVSDAEKATLAEISAALGTTPTTLSQPLRH